jgi:hypothetical protein
MDTKERAPELVNVVMKQKGPLACQHRNKWEDMGRRAPLLINITNVFHIDGVIHIIPSYVGPFLSCKNHPFPYGLGGAYAGPTTCCQSSPLAMAWSMNPYFN